MFLPARVRSTEALRAKAPLPRRKFTLRDTLVLVAATGVGLAWIRALGEIVVLDRWQAWLDSDHFGLVLMPWTFAVVGLRLLGPRPPLCRLVLQPGAAACGAVAFAFSMDSLKTCVYLLAENHGPHRAQDLHERLARTSYFSAIYAESYDAPVVVAWVLLCVSRRCRPEASWIDRTGRAIGLTWILLDLWFVWDFAWLQWQTAGK